MATASDVKILVVSKEMVKTGKGDLFSCLAGLSKVWQVDPVNVLEMYAETAEDGWDVVIIECVKACSVLEFVHRIHDRNKTQNIIVITTYPERMHASVIIDTRVTCLPYGSRGVGEAIKKIIPEFSVESMLPALESDDNESAHQ